MGPGGRRGGLLARLGLEQLGFWDAEPHPARFVVEPGTFGLYIGSSMHATHALTFKVT